MLRVLYADASRRSSPLPRAPVAIETLTLLRRSPSASDALDSRPSPWPAVAAFVVGSSLTLGSSFFVVFAVGWMRASGQRARWVAEASSFAVSAAGLMAAALTNAAVLACVAIIGARLQGTGVATGLRLRAARTRALGFAAATAGMVGLSVACGAGSDLIRAGGGGVLQTMELALRAPSPARFALAMATIAAAPGFAEETFFRGFIQTRLTSSWGKWPAIVFASATFGAIHLDPIQGSAAFLAGVYLGWLTERFDSIWPAVVAHVVNNGVFVALAAFDVTGPVSRVAKIAELAAGLATCASSIALLRTWPARR